MSNNYTYPTAPAQPVSTTQIQQVAQQLQSASAALQNWQASAIAVYPQEMIPRAIYARGIIGCGAVGAVAGAIVGAPFYGCTRAVADITCDIADLVGYLADRHAAKKAAKAGYVPTPAQPVYPPYPAAQPTLPPRFMRATDTATTLKVINDDPFMWLMHTIFRDVDGRNQFQPLRNGLRKHNRCIRSWFIVLIHHHIEVSAIHLIYIILRKKVTLQ